MITIEKALKLIDKNYKYKRIIKVNAMDSLGFVLAKNVYSKEDYPKFNNSAMDGYCIKYSDYNKFEYFKIKNKICAGDIANIKLKRGECAYITTGAKIPKDSTCVVPIEDVEKKGNIIIIKNKNLKIFENIRFKGEDIKKGSLILRKNTLIEPYHISLFSVCGIKDIYVYDKPKVSIIASGRELIKNNKNHINDSNLVFLRNALKKEGIKIISEKIIDDKNGELYKILKNSEMPDIYITTGGVSVSEKDYVKEDLEKFGVKKLFWKVKQKPGKPLYVGVKDKTLFFALPGNPLAVILIFYVYILPMIYKFQNKVYDKKRYYNFNINSESDKTLILASKYGNGKVEIFKNQSSHKLSFLANTNSISIPKMKELILL
jgi:molybdopterin molybdotransferase